ncbi:hypothetical protein C8Q74DRAFT_1272491 [Fomes fomentarius]|nr:hypothetical protein C8Q74DRAFT_1272491 [Fomes fomentarius]
MHTVQDPIGNSNADRPVLTPSIYSPDVPLGRRISNEGMPTSEVPRLYHSSDTLTPQGRLSNRGQQSERTDGRWPRRGVPKRVLGGNARTRRSFRRAAEDPRHESLSTSCCLA